MHRPRLYKIAHAVHHASRPPTAWAAMSFHPLEAVTGAVVIPVLVFVVPIHVAALGVVLAVMTLMGVTNHMGWEMFPKWLVHGPAGRWLITASHHELHHQKYRCNYGLYFRFWDRLCGTDSGLGEFAVPRARRARAAVNLNAASPPPPADLTVSVSGLRNHRGAVRVCLTQRADLYLKCDKDPKRIAQSLAGERGGESGVRRPRAGDLCAGRCSTTRMRTASWIRC